MVSFKSAIFIHKYNIVKGPPKHTIHVEKQEIIPLKGGNLSVNRIFKDYREGKTHEGLVSPQTDI